MHNLNDLVFFAEVAERGGFTAAARVLGVPKSRLSHRVAALEEVLGVQLLQRSTRRRRARPRNGADRARLPECAPNHVARCVSVAR